MPKSATDATRFTSTTPHASARPPTSTSSADAISKRVPRGPPGETPQQKVRRLREAAARARDAKVSNFDRVLVRGRVWADRAHRFTALSLIGLTGIAGVVTVYALGDMMIYNRRKRREYFAEQEAQHNAKVYDAQQAIKRGVMTEEQRELLENEERNRRTEEAKVVSKPPGIFSRSKAWLFSGLKKDEVDVDVDVGAEGRKLIYEGTVDGDDVTVASESPILRAVVEKEKEIAEEIKEATNVERRIEQMGGPLDRLGSDDREPPKRSGGWTSFMTGR